MHIENPYAMLARMPATLLCDWMQFWPTRTTGTDNMVTGMLGGGSQRARPTGQRMTSDQIEAVLINAHPKEWAAHQKKKAEQCQP